MDLQKIKTTLTELEVKIKTKPQYEDIEKVLNLLFNNKNDNSTKR